MKIQLLIATMHQKDHALPKKMNVQTSAIVGNQCDRNSIEEFEYNGNIIKYLNFAERGVGLNRNNALMRADGDIILFADDDMVYEDNYAEIVRKAFEQNPKADVILFNLKEKDSKRKQNKDVHRVRFYNFLRFGTARVAAKFSSLKNNGIYFNQCFGGGTEHCHGEDAIFFADCLKKGLKMYTSPEYIATLTNERESTWETDDFNKYLHDQGCLYRTISRHFWRLLCFQDAFRRHKSYRMKIGEAYKKMK